MPLQRLNAEADAVIKLAQPIAREFEQEWVGTEHVLLAILQHNHSLAARVLNSFKVDEARARLTINQLIEKSKEDTWVFGRLPGSPHFKNVVARAIEEAQQLESKEVGAEHLLLALLREQGCIAERALLKMGITLKGCRDEIVRQLSTRA